MAPTDDQLAQELQDQAQAETVTGTSLVESVLNMMPVKPEGAENLIEEFARRCLQSGSTAKKSSVAQIQQMIAEIDEKLTRQLNEIMHHEEFQQLESAWRGLNYLVKNTETSTRLKVRVMHASKKDLLDDLEKATEVDQSGLWKKIYEAEYGMFGGSPYGLLVGDYEFGRHPQDVDLLSRISKVAAAAHAPFISAANPTLFGLDSYEKLNAPRDLAKIFEAADMVKWRSFRETLESQYVALTLPRVLMRLPYGPDTKPVAEFRFVEDVTGSDHSKYSWGNSAYALGLRITNAFALYGWCTAIRGVEGGGLVEDLPLHTFRSDGEVTAKIPTEVAIPDRRDKELSDLGFMALCNRKGSDQAAFFSGQSANLPVKYLTPDATASANLSALLPNTLAVSRIAHYLKAIVRDKVGSFQSRQSMQTYLHNWLMQWVLAMDEASQEEKAKRPLREAEVSVTDTPGQPGYYRAVVRLRPHFQLEGLDTSLRLVADLPKAAK